MVQLHPPTFMTTEQLKKALTMTAKTNPTVRSEDLLSSGSTLLNLATSGNIRGAFPLGTYSHFVGDSQSGKTLICYNTLAEASINPVFDGYRLIYDNPERRAFWDMEKLWGSKLANRIEPPKGTRDDPIYSRTVQDFYFNLYNSFVWKPDGRVDVGKSTPFVWIADSMASLDDVAKWDKFETNVGLAEKGKDLEGSYGMGKAKANSDNILWVVNAVADTRSILIIINQTRDRIAKNMFDMGSKQTVAGGHGLKFYATYEMWSRMAGVLTRTVNGIKRQIGTDCEVSVKKNSVNGKLRSVTIPVYSSYGMDDLGSCVDYLLEERHWVKDGATVTAPEFGHVGTFEKLIKLIEENELEDELRRLVQRVWNGVEELCAVDRKSRYS